jgi:hypothetical protein
MAAATMADATADTLAMDAVLSSPDLLTLITRSLGGYGLYYKYKEEALLRAHALSSAQCVCRAWSLAFGDETAWQQVVFLMLWSKPCRYGDELSYQMAMQRAGYLQVETAPFPRMVQECLESERAKKWLYFFKAVMEDGQRQRLDEAELRSLCFDFRFRAAPDHRASAAFRFESIPAYRLFTDEYHFVSDARRAEAARLMAQHGRYSEEPEAHIKFVMNHPNGLDYEWALEKDGVQVKLGPYPRAWVRRLPDWRWVIANPNIVLIECGHITDDSIRDDAPERFPIPAELFAADLATQVWGQEGADAALAQAMGILGLTMEDLHDSDGGGDAEPEDAGANDVALAQQLGLLGLNMEDDSDGSGDAEDDAEYDSDDG